MLNISWTIRRAFVTLLGLAIPTGWVFAQPPAEVPQAEPPMAAEESPLLIEPTTPEDAFDAAALMQRLGRPGLAKRYLMQFLDANPDEALLLQIRDKKGPAVFLRLAGDPGLQPESKTLLEKVNDAFRKRGADPVRINKLIADLSGNPRERAVALETLKSGGTAVVPQMLASFANADMNQKSVLIGALAQMGSQAVPPLLGALESTNPQVRGGAAEALGYLGTQNEVPYLWRPAFGPDELPAATSEAARNALTQMLKPEGQRNFQVSSFGAPALLKRAVLEHYRGDFHWPLKDNETAVTIWTWDEQNQTVAAVPMTPQEASLYRGAQLARDALALSPEDQEAQALFLGFALANEQHKTGYDAPLPTGPNTAYQLALGSGADLVSRTLTQAMQNGNAAAAVASLQALSQLATRTQLYGTNAERSPILAALNYPDPRVQFAAAVTVLELAPDRDFPGASRVVEILIKALGNGGGPAVLVIDPNPTRASDVAGLLQQMGYQGQPITRLTGQTGFNAAIERNDVELVVVQANVTDWTLSQTLANFRADARTASLPILIHAPDWAESNVEKTARRFPLTAYALESYTLDHFRRQVEPFLSRLKSEPLTEQERASQAAAARDWLAHIASTRQTSIFDIVPAEAALDRSIANPDLATNAVQALAAIPTKTAQQRLEGIAVSTTQEVPLRELAAVQLAFHIQRHGLLLTGDQVREVEAAIPAAGDPQLASALTAVIGSLKPNPKAVGTQLQQFPIPSPIGP